MTEPLFSTSWYRVAELKPRLRSHATIHRHHYRGELWYVLADGASDRYHRFSPAAYRLIGLMDGQRTVQELWQQACTHLEDEAPTQNDVLQLLAQLHAADVLQCDVPPDTTELFLRSEQQRHRKWQGQLLNLLCWRVPLFDPEPTLQRFLPVARLLFSGFGTLLWCAVVGLAAVLAAVHWHDLTHNFADRVLVPQNILMLWMLFPVVKIAHEFGHGFATKVYGGEVHDMGVMLLALQPVPYVDASAASSFRSKWQRIVVGAAGMLVELFIAALALFVWLNVEPGTVHAVAYNIMIIAGVSTVLFNANPLMRYDGYYMFADFIEMPNLYSRSYAYMGYLCERYLFGRREAILEATTSGERAWFVIYAVVACVYRIAVLAALALFVAGKFFFVGVMLALGGMVAWVGAPTVKLLVYLCSSPRLGRTRLRAITVSVSLAALLIGVMGWLPLPLRTRAEGVIWIPEQAHVRAATDGFIERVVAQPGTQVRQGDVLLISDDPLLHTRVKVLEARLHELRTRYTVQWLENPGEAQLLKEDIAHVEERLARARQRVDELVIRSRANGVFVLPHLTELTRQFVKQGTEIGYVLDFSTVTARVVVPQGQIDLVRHQTYGIDVRLADRLSTMLPATILREVPAATGELPSTALGKQGGGAIVVDPSDTQGVTALHKLFQFDLALPSQDGIAMMGSRVYVRFDHGWEPLAQRWYRQLRQLFLAKFHV